MKSFYSQSTFIQNSKVVIINETMHNVVGFASLNTVGIYLCTDSLEGHTGSSKYLL